MFRGILYLILFTLVISVVKAVFQIVAKSMRDSSNESSAGAQRPRSSSKPIAGELRKDPVCGTFVSTATALQKKSSGELYYFCSADCRDKFKS